MSTIDTDLHRLTMVSAETAGMLALMEGARYLNAMGQERAAFMLIDAAQIVLNATKERIAERLRGGEGV